MANAGMLRVTSTRYRCNCFFWGHNRFERGASLSAYVAVPNDSPGGMATLSYEPEQLVIGDEVTIRIVDVETADAPVERNDGEGSYRIEIESSR